jgi:hypothetical protein
MLWLHHNLIIIRHTSPPFFLPERCLFLSARCMTKPGGSTFIDNIPRVSHASVKQRMLQYLMPLWKATLARISSTLLSSDWTLVSSILRSCERCARLRSLTRRPLRLPFLRRSCFGLPTGIRSFVLGGGPNRGLHRGSHISDHNVGKSWMSRCVQTLTGSVHAND